MVQSQSYYERRRDELGQDWERLSGQTPLAWLLLAFASAVFISNYREVEGPYNHMLGGITLMGIVGGCLWLWTIKRDQDRIIRLSLENNKELDHRADA